MTLFRRLKDWWLDQFRASGTIGKVALILVPLLVCGCYLPFALLFASSLTGGRTDPAPAAVVLEQTSKPVSTVALAATAELPVDAWPTATDLPVRPPATATDPPPAASTRTAALLPTTGPTGTPVPSPTPRASATPRPTSTSRPSPTPRPSATPLPLPTATAVPLPTWTPAPTLPLPTATAASGGRETAVVNYVVDGDTIDVTMNGTSYRVRYIGIDTPETDQTCGSEATQANAALVAGQTVTMVRDVSETDRYGRLLRYVYVGDTFVNGALVAGGWAVAKEYPPDTAMAGVLASLMQQGAGIGCALVAAPLPTQPPDRGPAPVGNCDPSYPTVCIPPAPPDLDCGDIPYRRFQVLPPDPHNFDGSDNDGVGCESG